MELTRVRDWNCCKVLAVFISHLTLLVRINFFKFLMHSYTSFLFDLLLGSFFMLLSHVHNCSSFRAIALVTVQTFEIFGNLIRCPTRLTSFTRILIDFIPLAHTVVIGTL